MIRDLARRGIDAGLAVTAPWFRRRGALRVLAYHDVRDPERFRGQLRHLTRHYTPVHAEQVVDAACGRAELPRRAVWVTFDDGDPSVLAHGMPALEAAGVRATMFVCPGVVGTTRPLWFQAVAASAGPDADRLLTELKRLDATTRQRRIQEVLDDAGPVRQATLAELQRFRDAGGHVCNHTWDHPLLDQVDPEEVRAQITRAHAWLAQNLPGAPAAFAYPNGNHSPHAEPVLRELGYRVALAFDHRVGSLAEPLRVSRIRVNTTDDPARFRASVSGAHPAWMRMRAR